MIVANGHPKTGTHALKKGIELLGMSPVEQAHSPYWDVLPPKPGYAHQRKRRAHPDDRVVTIFRHPRNMLLSKCRWEGHALATGLLINLVRDWNSLVEAHREVISFRDSYASYVEWCADDATLAVTYEALMAGPAELQKIATWLKVPYLDDAFTYLEGLTITYKQPHSRWEDAWSVELDRVWADEGMQSLQEAMGY